MKVFLIALCLVIGSLFGGLCIHSWDQNVQKVRVYQMFGQGDEGEEVNYWLQTGDTTTAYEWNIPISHF